jgi:sarcosine oxidase, subunit beta
MPTADVVIIGGGIVGGGIVGSSIAYHLTAAGCRNVLVLERESAQGKGSTGKSMAADDSRNGSAVNTTFSSRVNTLVSRIGEDDALTTWKSGALAPC